MGTVQCVLTSTNAGPVYTIAMRTQTAVITRLALNVFAKLDLVGMELIALLSMSV